VTEEEKKDVVDETTQDETAEAAGPVAEDGESSSQAAGDSPSSTPPAAEAESSGDETVDADSSDEPEAEQEESEAAEPAAEETAPAEEAGEESEEDQLPWKEKRRLERSRRPHKPGPARTPEERVAERAQRRNQTTATASGRTIQGPKTCR